MRVTFVRTIGAKDRIYVLRDDGTETSWAFPTYGEELPHDLFHLMVEGMLGVTRGVWGRVAAGADLQRINEEANRGGGKDKYRALGDDLDQVLVAETLANAPWTRLELAPTPDDVLQHIRAAAASLPLPDTLTVEAVAELRQRFFALRDRWRALVPRGALVFRYPPTDEESLSGYG